MELSRLVRHINLATDEEFELLDVIAFINDSIAKINSECGSNLPFVDDTLPERVLNLEEYTALPETWIRMLIVPFSAGRIKENDSSQFEYIDWYSQFDMNLREFKAIYEIPEEYASAPNTNKGGHYQDTFDENPYNPMKGW